MKLIKLTDENGKTCGNTQWGENVTHSVEWSGRFCSTGCLHAYKDLHVALFLNPIHARIERPVAWIAEGEVLKSDQGMKFGLATLTTIEKIEPLPIISSINRVAFGILCALEVCKEPTFVLWANRWLLRLDRLSAFTALTGYTAATAYERHPKRLGAAAAAAARYAAAAAATAATATADIFVGFAASDAAYAAVNVELDWPILAKRAMEVI